MQTASSKAKGRKLQQWVRDKILSKFRTLSSDDVRSTSMGASGEDVQLSPAARQLFPFSIECKARKALAVYAFYDQAKANADGAEPLLIVKANQKKPLVILDAEYFFNNWPNPETF